MGACMSVCPGLGSIAPDADEVYDVVFENILLAYHRYLREYHVGMEQSFPNAYTCEDVVDSNFKGGKRKLTKGVDDEKRVKDSALMAATSSGARAKAGKEAWDQLEPTVEEQAEAISIPAMRSAAIAAAEKVTEEAAEMAFDKARDQLAEQLAKGRDLPQPKKKSKIEETAPTV